jgi:hypothetical protein
MELATYNEFRRELIRLSEKAARLQALDDEKRGKLEQVRERIQRDLYRIALFSPFQGGKSTIFNTILGGRELSPTGSGLKTSACVAEAHHLAKGEEYAEVEWRDGKELVLSFLEVLPQPQRKAQGRLEALQEKAGKLIDNLPLLTGGEREGGRVGWLTELEDLRSRGALTLDEPWHRSLLESAIAARQEERERARDRFPSDHVALLKIARLTLRHYGALRDIQGKAEVGRNRISLDRASSWIRFPEDWEERDPDRFAPEELVFLFLRWMRFHVRSQELQQLGAVVVDCPGFQASSWDSLIARQCIEEAEAVVFLLGTEGRQISEEGLRQAQFLANFRRKDLLLAYNAKGIPRFQAERLLRSDLNLLRETGLSIPEERTVIFNALLALRSRQYQMIEEMPEDLVQALSDRARGEIDGKDLPDGGADDLRNASYLIGRDLAKAYFMFTDRQLGEVDTATVLEAEQRSNWRPIFEQAAQFIVRRRARTLLIDRGTAEVGGILEQFREDLSVREQLAKTTEDEFKARKVEAEQALQIFVPRAREVRDQLIVRLRVGGPVYRELRRELKDDLQEARRDLRKQLQGVIEKTSSRWDLHPRLTKKAAQFLAAQLSEWRRRVEALDQGESVAVQETFVRDFARAEETMKALVVELHKEGQLLLSGLSLKLKLPEIQERSLENLTAAVNEGYRSEKLLRQARERTDGWGQFFTFVTDAFEEVRKEFLDEAFDRKAHIEALDRSFLDPLFGEGLRDEIDRQAGEVVSSFELAVGKEFDRAISSLEKAFSRRVEDSAKDLAQGQEARERIARECSELRSRVLEPLQAEVQRFTEEVEQTLAAEPGSPRPPVKGTAAAS